MQHRPLDWEAPPWRRVGLRFRLTGLIALGLSSLFATRADAVKDRAARTAEYSVTGEPDAVQSRARLDALIERGEALAPGKFLPLATGPLAFWIDATYQGATNPYADDSVRYVALRLVVINSSDAPQTFATTGIGLNSGGKRLTLDDRPTELESYSFRVGNTNVPLREAVAPAEMTVAPGAAAAAWLVFSHLDAGPFVPEMTLELPLATGPLSISLSEFEAARLDLDIRRIGPRGCLAVLELNGLLNTVNVAHLVDELASLRTSGVARAVVHWSDEALLPEDSVLRWLQQGIDSNPYNRQFNQLPPLPNDIRELHISGLEELTQVPGVLVHRTLESAVDAALASAFEIAPPQDVAAAIRGDDRLVRIAALSHGGARLPAEGLPLILQAFQTGDDDEREAALRALQYFDDDNARQALANAASGDNVDLAASALESLARSRFPEASAALQEVLTGPLTIPPVRLLEVLAGTPRPEWRDVVYQFARHDEVEVRIAALRALERLGHPEFRSLLTEALASDDATLREVAFNFLVGLDERSADAEALEYTLAQLEAGPPSPAIQQFLGRIRDPRAIPPLLKQLESATRDRGNLIQLLAQLGDAQVVAVITERFDEFDNTEKVAALMALQQLSSPVASELALKSLATDDVNLINHAIQILQSHPSEEAVAEMARVLKSLADQRSNSAAHFLCNGLGMIGTPAARDALLEAWRSDNDLLRNASDNGLRILRDQSPAAQSVRQALQHSLQADELETQRDAAEGEIRAALEEQAAQQRKLMDEHLALAERLDPEHPGIFEFRAALRDAAGDREGAIALLTRAVELGQTDLMMIRELAMWLMEAGRFADALPYYELHFERLPDRHDTLTSIALCRVRLGEIDAAIALTDEHWATFEKEPVFLYNVACVYSRSTEQVSATHPNDPRIAEWKSKAIGLLESAFAADIHDHAVETDMYEFSRNDPDLAALHAEPGFRKLFELDLPEEQRTKPPPRAESTPDQQPNRLRMRLQGIPF
jgi:HEAT repeat protein